MGIKNARGKIVKEYYLKKDSKHLIWVKWIDPFQDVLEDDNDGAECKWSAEPQSIFEGHMKKMVKEALEKNGQTQEPKAQQTDGSCDMPLRQKLTPLDNLVATLMAHLPPLTRRVKMKTKTTKYKLIKCQLLHYCLPSYCLPSLDPTQQLLVPVLSIA